MHRDAEELVASLGDVVVLASAGGVEDGKSGNARGAEASAYPGRLGADHGRVDGKYRLQTRISQYVGGVGHHIQKYGVPNRGIQNGTAGAGAAGKKRHLAVGLGGQLLFHRRGVGALVYAMLFVYNILIDFLIM